MRTLPPDGIDLMPAVELVAPAQLFLKTHPEFFVTRLIYCLRETPAPAKFFGGVKRSFYISLACCRSFKAANSLRITNKVITFVVKNWKNLTN